MNGMSTNRRVALAAMVLLCLLAAAAALISWDVDRRNEIAKKREAELGRPMGMDQMSPRQAGERETGKGS